MHLLTNASILGSPDDFQANVDRIHSLGAVLPIVEWAFIFIPLIFHGLIGLVIIRSGHPNAGSYPYASNIRYTLQRATGMIAFVFILWHVLNMHWLGAPLRPVDPEFFARFDPHDAASSAAAALQHSRLNQIFYLVGVFSAIYHFSNGIWTFGITWGLWTSASAMRRASYISLAVGLFLGSLAIGTLWKFTTMEIPVSSRQSVDEK